MRTKKIISSCLCAVLFALSCNTGSYAANLKLQIGNQGTGNDGSYDSVKISEATKLHKTSYLELYTKINGSMFNSGAINEQPSGVLYGVPHTREDTSMYMSYFEYGQTEPDYLTYALNTAQRTGKAVEVAFNMPNEGNDIPEVINNTDYLNQIADILAQYPDIKIFFRFGAEFDVWGIPADKEEYKQAFKVTADIIHAKTDNVAMVFSPNMVSSWYDNMLNYYPGDEYVDWIGVSLYMKKYFMADKSRPERETLVFCSGDSAEPVLILKKFVDAFPDKPIMISESGASHYVHKDINEDTTWWAVPRIQMLYGFVPMVYPQVKMIGHFDNYLSWEADDYSLKNNEIISNLYNVVTKDDIFIQNSAENTANVSYQHLTDSIYTDGTPMEFATYAHIYGNTDLKVNYYIDGEWAGGTNEIPYKAKIDMSNYAEGEHKMKVSCEADGKEVMSKNYTLIGTGKKQQAEDITVYVDGNQVIFDQPPVIRDGRTLVPLRAIFEAMNAYVSWNNETKTASASKDGIEISIQINKNELIRNGEVIELDVPACIINDRTMVPARAIGEAFGAKVDWNQELRRVIIVTE